MFGRGKNPSWPVFMNFLSDNLKPISLFCEIEILRSITYSETSEQRRTKPCSILKALSKQESGFFLRD